VLSEARLVRLINGLEQDDQNEHLLRKLLDYYLDHYDRLAVVVRLKLIRRMVQQEQPRQALKTADELASETLTESQKANLSRLVDHAKRQIAEGVIEVRFED
jgi:Trp operon repressor